MIPRYVSRFANDKAPQKGALAEAPLRVNNRDPTIPGRAGLFVRIGRYLLVKACKNAEKRELLSVRNRCICATRSQNRREPRHFPLHSPPPFGDATLWFNPLTLGAPMKKLLLASVAGVALIAAGSANAADLGRPVYKAPPPVAAPVPVFSWTGCFVGAHWGWGWGRKDVHETEFTTDAAFAASGNINTSGAIFGGQVGCDYQFGLGKAGGGPGGWVIGIQFDGAGTDINGFRTDPFAEAFADPFGAAIDGRIAV